MSAPLTTRDALAEVLAQHDGYGGNRFCECLPTDEDGCREPLGVSWEQHLADALLASGALIDAGKLAEEVARIRQWLWKASQGDHTRIREAGIMQEACAQLDAALSAQSERAEVER